MLGLRGKTEHGGGIDATAEEEPDGDVADHVEADRFFEDVEKARFRLPGCDWRRFEGEVPVLAVRELPFPNGQGGAGRELFDVAEDGFVTRHVVEGEKAVQDLRIDFGGEAGEGKKGFDFRGEDERARGERIVERLDADAVSSEKERASALVPDGEREHATQFFDAAFAEVFIEVDDDFGVGAGFERMAALEEVFAKVPEVVDFAVEDNPDGAVLVGKRLVTAFEVDDREAAKAKADVRGDVEAGVIGAAMGNGIGHGLDKHGRDAGLGIKDELAANAAHAGYLQMVSRPQRRSSCWWRRKPMVS